MDNARDNRGAATRTEVKLVSGYCRTGFTTSVHPIVIRRTANKHCNSSGLPTQSRACPIMSSHQECQFAERITRSCALRSNRLTMFPSNLPLYSVFQFDSCSRIINPENNSTDNHVADRISSQPVSYTHLTLPTKA